MKKIGVYIMSVLMFFAVNLPILAKTIYEDQKFTQESKTFREYSKTAEKSTQYQNKKPEIIICNEQSTDELFKSLEFSKVEINLDSYLKKRHKAYLYTLKNNSDKNIEITYINGFKNPQSAISGVVNKRARFPKSLTYITDGLGWTVVYVLLAGYIWVPLAIGLSGSCGDPEDDKINSTLLLTAPISAPAIGLWTTIAGPYYYFSDKKNDEVAKLETNKLINKFKIEDMESLTELQFPALIRRKYESHEQKYNYLITIRFKEKDLDTVYEVKY